MNSDEKEFLALALSITALVAAILSFFVNCIRP